MAQPGTLAVMEGVPLAAAPLLSSLVYHKATIAAQVERTGAGRCDMLAINGFLRGLWVGILAVLIWGALSGITGWGWMLPQTQWVFLLAMVVAGLAKIVRDSGKTR